MGKVPTAPPPTAAINRRKKGRPPSKDPVPLPSPAKSPISNSAGRRSTRLNPNHLPDVDDDDERKEKKVKLVVRLPPSEENAKSSGGRRRHSRDDSDSDSGSGSGSGSGPGSDQESEDRAKKRKVNGGDRGSGDEDSAQDKEAQKATDTSPNGSQLESGPTRTPLPEKKLLVFILDRLQKKDTYGVFSEPVDPNELPDYFDIIDRPMDFGTVRKKLSTRAYKSLEELEADVFLICSNAMQYNSSDTVYYRQARTIQELAKRDFENLKHEGDDGAPQPKIVRRGRPPGNKNQKKPVETSTVDTVERVAPEVLSGATLASEEDNKASGSNSYNLRKGPALLRSRFSDTFVSPNHRARNGENYSEWSADWNNEFPASILRADMKHGKKHLTVDENKRDTYRQSLSLGNNLAGLSRSVGKRIAPVGLLDNLSYARSLARFAANLGPVAWKIASKKIEAVLPAGVEYGPGWVGDNGAPSCSTEKQTSSNNTVGDCSSSKLRTPPAASDLSSAVTHRPSEVAFEAVKNLNSQNEVPRQGDVSSWSPHYAAQKTPMPHPYRNGFTGMIGFDPSASSAARVTTSYAPTQMVETASSHSSATNHHAIPEQGKAPEARMWNLGKSPVQQQQRHQLSIPPDLNIRVSASSPSSSLQIGSPRQPDLALQL